MATQRVIKDSPVLQPDLSSPRVESRTEAQIREEVALVSLQQTDEGRVEDVVH